MCGACRRHRTFQNCRALTSRRLLDSQAIDRLLGQCGRVADTPDPWCYELLFRAASGMFRGRLKYGFMVTINLVLHGSVHHPLYREKRTPQMAPVMLFKRHEQHWIPRCVLWLHGGGSTFNEPDITCLYGDFGVEVLVVHVNEIALGYHETADFKRRLNLAVDGSHAAGALHLPSIMPNPLAVA